jgi:hypothetical protein
VHWLPGVESPVDRDAIEPKKFSLGIQIRMHSVHCPLVVREPSDNIMPLILPRMEQHSWCCAASPTGRRLAAPPVRTTTLTEHPALLAGGRTSLNQHSLTMGEPPDRRPNRSVRPARNFKERSGTLRRGRWSIRELKMLGILTLDPYTGDQGGS